MKNKLNFLAKTLPVKTLLVLLVIGMMDSAAFSQERIRFARGKSSATVKGKLAKGRQHTYVLGAKEGQMMTVKIEAAGNIWFDIGGNEIEESSITIECRSTDDYEITVHNNDEYSTDYSLFVAVN